MSSLYEKIGVSSTDALLADPQGVEMIAIPCTPGNGRIERGTVMYRAETGMYLPAPGDKITDANYLVVLEESVDTDANATIAEDARAYRQGRLIAGRVKTKEGTAVTQAQQVVLRKQGITLRQKQGTETFNNEKSAEETENESGSKG